MRKLTTWMILSFVVVGLGSTGLAAPSSPQATTLTVGSGVTCKFGTIEAALAAANPGDTIQVQDNVFTENPLTIVEDLTLEGGFPGVPLGCLQATATSHTVVQRVGATNDRILEVTGAVVTIRAFVFEQNANGGGVSALENSTLNLEDVIISDNQADWGAGLRVVDSTANLTDCRIDGNESAFSGAGLDVWGTDRPASVTLTRVHLTANQAGQDGGGMHVEGDAQVTTHDWVMIGANDAGRDGAGIHAIDSAQVTINASDSQMSYVMENVAAGHGGGIYLNNARLVLNGLVGVAFLDQLAIASNRADHDLNNVGDGGGIYATNGARIDAAQSTIVDNRAYSGGGVYLSDSTFTAEDLFLNKNDATADGGGLWVGEGSTVALSQGSQISDWNSTQPNTAQNGGGIYAEGRSKITLDNTEIRGNEAVERGCGVYVTGAATFTATMSSTIALNEGQPFQGVEGGGIYATGDGTNVIIDASQISTNTAFSRGGGLYIGAGAQATIQNDSQVLANQTKDLTAGGAGAWVSGPDATLSVQASDFLENRSGFHGGGIYNDGGMVSLDGAHLEENLAWQHGGGLYNDNGTVEGIRSAFYANKADSLDGGGLCTRGPDGSVNIRQSYFLANEAPSGNGGAIVTDHSQLTVHRSYFIANSSHGQGGAIHVVGTCCPGRLTLEVVNSYLVNNLITPLSTHGPPGNGSELYVEGAPAALTHNTFAHQVQESFAVYIADGSEVTLTNTIISNYAVGIRRPSAGTGTATAAYTLFHNNAFDYDTSGITSVSEVHGDPAFAGPSDYHLTEGSDAINAGVDAGVSIDFDGDSRPWAGGFDIGADEYGERHRIFVPLVSKDHP